MNVANRTLFIADNLDIMRGIDSETIDLIYLDPPFNTNRNYKAPIGSAAEGAQFKDIWTDADIKQEWHGHIAAEHEELYQVIHASEFIHGKSMKIYLTAMAVRLFEMQRLLKPSGSIYLHCDPTASHYLKLILDDMFNGDNFRNEIVWHYYNGSSNSKRNYARKHDTILFYANGKENMFDDVAAREPYAENSNWVKNPKSYGGDYKANPNGKRMHDVWRIPSLNNMAKERTGYPTQKPLALLDRIIKASSNENDVVLDPFCGCATACVAAEKLQRQWIGID
ncbi:site-specific DNA-methyltransferase, partial [Candidatus Poribacteria bacterium]|nr:site-specific DNA-methyltransferase [Candidatus Poribacteria bacterium]